MFGLLNKKKISGQSTLELTISLVVIIMLLAGMVRLFIWLSTVIVGRQKAYMSDYRTNIMQPDAFYKGRDIPIADIAPPTVYPRPGESRE